MIVDSHIYDGKEADTRLLPCAQKLEGMKGNDSGAGFPRLVIS